MINVTINSYPTTKSIKLITSRADNLCSIELSTITNHVQPIKKPKHNPIKISISIRNYMMPSTHSGVNTRLYRRFNS